MKILISDSAQIETNSGMSINVFVISKCGLRWNAHAIVAYGACSGKDAVSLFSELQPGSFLLQDACSILKHSDPRLLLLPPSFWLLGDHKRRAWAFEPTGFLEAFL